MVAATATGAARPAHLAYRADIDGLRAVAVLSVILYHANPAFAPTGYAGVDVFFVISGYLITGIIAKEMERGDFSLARFYERRIRRILPALIVTLLGTFAMAWWALTPGEHLEFSGSLLATLFFVANYYFAGKSGYFDAPADHMPLLHMWSLGIEEQFYIIAPPLLAVLLLRSRSLALAGLSAIVIASLIWMLVVPVGQGFFPLTTRAWELGIGALAALGLFPNELPQRVRNALAVIGGLMVVSVFFPIASQSEWPGPMTLLPVVGTLLLIQFGKGSGMNRLLATGPMVAVGKISFSLYLIHWPVFVFARLAGFEFSLGVELALLVGAVFLLSFLSYRYVETPFRQRGVMSVGRVIGYTGGGYALLALLAVGSMQSSGYAERFSPEQRALAAARHDVSEDRERCHVSEGIRPYEEQCVLGDGDVRTALWGDSHGVELARAIADAGVPLRQITYSACPPSREFSRPDRPDCAAHNAQMVDAMLADVRLDTIMIAANWEYWEPEAGMAKRIAAMTDKLVDGGKRVIVIGPSPEPGFHVPRSMSLGWDRQFGLGSARRYDEGLTLAKRASQTSEYFDLTDLFCNDDGCSVMEGGEPLFYDDHHLSMAGARRVAEALVAEKGLR